MTKGPAKPTAWTRKAVAGATPLPEFVPPCLAEAIAQPPSGDAWVHEIKLDGYRMQARLAGGKVSLLTRRGLDWTARFPALAKALAALPATTALIDGEAIAEDERGVASFALLVDSLTAKRSRNVAFVAFDLLHLDGESLLDAPLAERKARLEALLAALPPESPIRYSQHIAGDGRLILEAAGQLGVEGIVSKRLDSPYRPGRRAWTKTKIIASDEFVIAGYVDSKGMTGAIGSLVLGYYDAAGRLIHAGRVGTGFSHKAAADIWQALQPLRTDRSPFPARLTASQGGGVIWLRPELVAAVSYLNWTAEGLVRHARMKALRQDIAAADVRAPAGARGGNGPERVR